MEKKKGIAPWGGNVTVWDHFLTSVPCPRIYRRGGWAGHTAAEFLVAQEGPRSKMADTAAAKEYSMTEVATHTTKESTWLVIKDMNDGGK